MDSGMYKMDLNGLLVEVDSETARLLSIDEVFRGNYEKAIREQFTADNNESSQEQPLRQAVIWTTKKNTPKDLEATSFFLQLRKNMSVEFDDKKNCKNNLWQKIAKKLNENGFYVGDIVDGGERCRKKFSNLQAAYVKYKDKKRQTGEGSVEEPPFFDEINEILGSKDKITPPIIIDTISITPTESPHEQPSTSTGITNKFENTKRTVKPDKNKLLSNLIEMRKEEMDERKKEFNRVMTFLENSSKQRHEQIMALFKKRKDRKRKYESDSESDD